MERRAARAAADRARSLEDAAKPKVLASEKSARAAEEMERKRVKREKRRAAERKLGQARRAKMEGVFLIACISFIRHGSLIWYDFIDGKNDQRIRRSRESAGEVRSYFYGAIAQVKARQADVCSEVTPKIRRVPQ